MSQMVIFQHHKNKNNSAYVIEKSIFDSYTKEKDAFNNLLTHHKVKMQQ